jgi:hypothetical protein
MSVEITRSRTGSGNLSNTSTAPKDRRCYVALHHSKSTLKTKDNNSKRDGLAETPNEMIKFAQARRRHERPN